jgi:hypothetical protein
MNEKDIEEIDGSSNVDPENKEHGEEEKKKKRSISKILNLSQYMRQENDEDVELVEKLRRKIKPPDGWKEIEKLEDFRPAYWFKKDDFVIQLYSIMGSLAIVLGVVDKKISKEDEDEMDLTMIKPIIPYMEIPYLNEEEEEDWETAIEKTNDYIEEIIEYIDEISKKDDEDDKSDDEKNKKEERKYKEEKRSKS